MVSGISMGRGKQNQPFQGRSCCSLSLRGQRAAGSRMGCNGQRGNGERARSHLGMLPEAPRPPWLGTGSSPRNGLAAPMGVSVPTPLLCCPSRCTKRLQRMGTAAPRSLADPLLLQPSDLQLFRHWTQKSPDQESPAWTWGVSECLHHPCCGTGRFGAEQRWVWGFSRRALLHPGDAQDWSQRRFPSAAPAPPQHHLPSASPGSQGSASWEFPSPNTFTPSPVGQTTFRRHI